MTLQSGKVCSQFLKSLAMVCHCEEYSDEAIPKGEIATLPQPVPYTDTGVVRNDRRVKSFQELGVKSGIDILN